jgi:NAD(P)-dependent dehydrogenase (short-subunit alcohol dehydrogenase family)
MVVGGKDRGPVLVTGASSGIGYDIAVRLASMGCPVFATVRNAADADRIAGICGLEPILLDVREPGMVEAAAALVERRGTGLSGLVNNAGIGGLGLLATWSDFEMRDIFEVNVFGVHRMTNAFLGMLVSSRGRIVNIGSQGGTIAPRYYGPYTMTKHALEAYTDVLAVEMEPYGVGVSIVQPGGIVTNAGRNSIEGTLERFARAAGPFADEAAQVLSSFRQPPPDDSVEGEESETRRRPSPPSIVTDAVLDALFSETPKRRYLVGTKWEGDRVLNALIGRLLDENDNPAHGYSRDELVAILDRHLAGRAGG